MWHFKEAAFDDTISESKLGEFFSNSACEAVVREAIQNSLDATPNSSSEATTVVFSFETIPFASIASAMKAVCEHCNAVGRTVDEGQKVRALLIEDFNTTGLEGSVNKFAAASSRKSFYSFWWEEGRSNKKVGSGGSHGVGKSTLSNASDFNTFLALTRRAASPNEALIGYSILPPHVHNETQYLGYARFGDLVGAGNSKKLMPYSGNKESGIEKLKEFRASVKPVRSEENGLSIFIPWVNKDITPEAVIKTVVKNYFLPIIKENLVVKVSDRDRDREVTITKSNILEIADEYFTETRDHQDVCSALSLAMEAARIEGERSYFYLSPNAKVGKDNDRIRENSFSDGNLAQMREEYADGKVIAIQFDLPISVKDEKAEKGYSPKQGYFRTYVQNTGEKAKIYRAFRGDILIYKESCSTKHPFTAAIVDVFNDDVGNRLSDYMKYTEDPGHGEWKNSAPKQSDRLYEWGENWQKAFVQKAVTSLLNVLTGQVENEKIADFAEDIFFIERELPDDTLSSKTGQRSKRTRPGDDPPDLPPVPPKKPALFAVEKLGDGFRVKATSHLAEHLKTQPMVRGEIKAAFIMPGVSKSRWFNSHIAEDFDFSSSLSLESAGVTLERRDKNEIIFSTSDANFEITATGFDMNRDLHIDAREVRDQS